MTRLTKLGWTAKTNFEEGLRKTYHWYLDNVVTGLFVARLLLVRRDRLRYACDGVIAGQNAFAVIPVRSKPCGRQRMSIVDGESAFWGDEPMAFAAAPIARAEIQY